MYYPGDRIPFVLSLAAAGTVTAPPILTILNSFDNTALDIAGVGVKSASMALVAGSDALYLFNWDTSSVADGTYLALVSYAAGGVTVNNRYCEKVQVGDSRVREQVAGAAQTARVSDLPDKAAVMLKTDFVAPAADAAVQVILGKINSLPASPASEATLTSILAAVGDVRDCELGTWSQDRSVVPNRLRFYRLDGTILQEFDLINNDTSSSRTRR